MKRTCHFCILLTVLVLISSCQKDEDDIPLYISGFFTASTDNKAHIYKLTDDMGNVYNVENDDLIFDYDSRTVAYNTNVRIIASIRAKKDSTYVIVSKAYPWLRKAIPESDENEKMHDPLKLNGIYAGGGYLNAVLGIMVESEQTAFESYCTYKTSKKTPNRITFTLYHDVTTDNPVYTYTLYLSIPLKTTKYSVKKNDTICFRYTSFEGDCVEKLIYR